MNENNKGFMGFCYGILIAAVVGIIIWASPKNYKVKSPVNPKVQITYTEGVPDTVYIYQFY